MGLAPNLSVFQLLMKIENMTPNQALYEKQQSIIPIAAFTANGDWKG
jgi:hypothetical protein